MSATTSPVCWTTPPWPTLLRDCQLQGRKSSLPVSPGGKGSDQVSEQDQKKLKRLLTISRNPVIYYQSSRYYHAQFGGTTSAQSIIRKVTGHPGFHRFFIAVNNYLSSRYCEMQGDCARATNRFVAQGPGARSQNARILFRRPKAQQKTRTQIEDGTIK